jgi:hypothetical protein
MIKIFIGVFIKNNEMIFLNNFKFFLTQKKKLFINMLNKN